MTRRKRIIPLVSILFILVLIVLFIVIPYLGGLWLHSGDKDQIFVNTTEIKLVLDNSYNVGETIDIKITNLGTAPYLYRSDSVCSLEFFDADGAGFMVLEKSGLRCDLISYNKIYPEETVSLFTWNLNGCLRAPLGCSIDNSKPLPSGDYIIRGNFLTIDKSMILIAEEQISIIGEEG